MYDTVDSTLCNAPCDKKFLYVDNREFHGHPEVSTSVATRIYVLWIKSNKKAIPNSVPTYWNGSKARKIPDISITPVTGNTYFELNQPSRALPIVLQLIGMASKYGRFQMSVYRLFPDMENIRSI